MEQGIPMKNFYKRAALLSMVMAFSGMPLYHVRAGQPDYIRGVSASITRRIQRSAAYTITIPGTAAAGGEAVTIELAENEKFDLGYGGNLQRGGHVPDHL